MTVMYLTGHVLDMLKLLPDNYIHCCVTSPPYWGLRSYDGGKDIVWGGKEDCRHQWVGHIEKPRGGVSLPDNMLIVGANKNFEANNRGHNTVTNFCYLCGAWRGQLGSEPTIDLYISHLVEIFREVRRVLRPDGQFWLNIGDSAAGSGGAHKPEHANPGLDKSAVRSGVSSREATDGLKPLDTCLIPFRLALSLQADKWYVHSDNIWAKSNPMPRSYNGWRWEKHRIKIGNRGRGAEKWRAEVGGQDHDDNGGFKADAIWRDCPGCPKCSPNDGYVLRKGSWSPTESHEYIFQFVKSIPYFGDREAVKEPIAESTVGRGKVSFGGAKGRAYKPDESDPNFRNGTEQWGREYDYSESNSNGRRNLRSVWEFPTQGFKGSHFAVFPPKLAETCIKASTSEYGVCDKCGSPWARVVERRSAGISDGYDSKYKDKDIGQSPSGFTRSGTQLAERELSRKKAVELFPDNEEAQKQYIYEVHEHGGTGGVSTVGFRPTCTCALVICTDCGIVLDYHTGKEVKYDRKANITTEFCLSTMWERVHEHKMGEGQGVLLSTLRIPVQQKRGEGQLATSVVPSREVRWQSGDNEGLCSRSGFCEQWVCNGASLSNGATLRTETPRLRGRTPLERRQIGQPLGEPPIDDKAGSRQLQESNIYDPLSEVQSFVSSSRSCVHCGSHRLKLVAYPVSKPVCLDPFGGSGTTSMVAEHLGCDSIYIDSSSEYTEMAKNRVAEDEEKRIAEFVKKAKNGHKIGT